MSVLYGAALAVGLFVALPAIAHLLRRGRANERPFPPARLVPTSRTVARRERRVEDQALFSLRAFSVLLLACLGAAPLVKCSRLSLARDAGGSVAVAFVLDDSLSMRAAPAGAEPRFEQALTAAREILASMREGDAVALVLAGKPARLALGSTTDLGLARRVLDEISPSDRATDLTGAVALARGVLVDPARQDRRLIVLSDFAGDPLPPGEPLASAPLPALGEPAPDCGVVSAQRRGGSVRVSVACNEAASGQGRTVELVAEQGSTTDPGPAAPAKLAGLPALSSVPLEARVGLQALSLRVADEDASRRLAVRLTGTDRLLYDDIAPVMPDSASLGVAVLSATPDQGEPMGGAPVVEQALAALDKGVNVRPLSVLPDQASELDAYALILLDDPPGTSPEAREALTRFVEGGGVAVALLGPHVESTKLGSTLEPFARGSVRWERDPSPRGADVASIAWLGTEGKSLSDLALHGRAVLDPGAEATVLATLNDGAPFVIERRLGAGRVFTVTVPSSLDESDFALRPGFVALVAHVLDVAEQCRGVRQSVAGASWRFEDDRTRIDGPEGAVELHETPEQGRVATPAVRGTYRVTTPRGAELRTVTLDPTEILTPPRPPGAAVDQRAGHERESYHDLSTETAAALLAVLALELALRSLGRSKRGRPAAERAAA